MHRLILAQGRPDIGHLASHMSNLMHRILESRFQTGSRRSDWTPAVDVSETAEGYEVIVELAGVRRNDIEVFTENHRLIVSGWRGDPTSRAKTCVHQMEIEQGRFCRSLRLPADADEEGVSAKYREGLLVLTVPKRKAAAT
jgi:HSP20 family protein